MTVDSDGFGLMTRMIWSMCKRQRSDSLKTVRTASECLRLLLSIFSLVSLRKGVQLATAVRNKQRLSGRSVFSLCGIGQFDLLCGNKLPPKSSRLFIQILMCRLR